MVATTSVRPRGSVSLLVLGLVLIVFGLLVGRFSRDKIWGGDFGQVYVAGKMMAQGQNMYDVEQARLSFERYIGKMPTWGMFYPPSAGLVILPLALLPYPLAQFLLFWATLAALLCGVWQLLALFAPDWPLSHRVLVLGLVLCSSTTRWGLLLLQPAPLALGLLGIYLAALLRGRLALALVCALIVVCLKPTLGLPFFGLALLQRRYLLTVSIAALWLLLSGLGFARMGGMQAVTDYRENMAQLEAPGSINSANPYEKDSHERTDWAFLLNAIQPDIPRSQALSLALSLGAAGWLLWEGYRCRAISREAETAGAFLGPLVCLSLVSIYHHRYDAVLLMAPVLVFAAQRKERPMLPGRIWFLAVTLPYTSLYVVSILQWLYHHFSDMHLMLLWKLFGTVSTLAAFAVSLVALHQYLAARCALGNEAAEPTA